MEGHFPVRQNVFGTLFYASVLLVMTSHIPTVRSSLESVDNYHVQVRLYVEPSAVESWKKMSGKTTFEEYTTEINSYFVEVQKVYESLSEFNTVAITFEIENITKLEDNVMNDPAARSSMTMGLQAFRNSIYYDYLDYGAYDMAILITGFNLGHWRLGFANINKVCDINAVGVLQQKETQNMVLVMAHEMGHILGAQHDADLYEDQSCYKDSGRVMNPSVHRFSPNRFSFSSCSNSDFENYLGTTTYQSNRRNCLKDGNKTVTGERLGSLIPPDEYCKRSYLRGDFVSRSHYHTNNYDRMCKLLDCVTMTGARASTMVTLQGTKCGKNKVCNRQVCEESFDGSPFVLDSCPLGDQPRVGPNFDKTCADIDPSECSKYIVECCYTCNKTNPVLSMTADDVCRELAGDKFVMLRSSMSQGDTLCSELKCSASEDGRKFDTKHFEAPDGMACGKNKRCHLGKCELTKHGNPNIPDECPFGDQELHILGYTGTCQKHSQTKRSCNSWGSTCCQSCQGK